MQSTRITIPHELFATAESSTFSGTLEMERLELGPDEYRFDQPLAWQVDVTNTGDGLLVAGRITGTGTTSCGRCLDDVDVAIDGDVEEYFLLQPPEDDAEKDDDDPDEFEILPDDHVIDMEPILQAAVVLDLPTVPLCSESCKGLCPDCGANLNAESCECAAAREQANREFDQLKNPFSVLQELDLSEHDEEG